LLANNEVDVNYRIAGKPAPTNTRRLEVHALANITAMPGKRQQGYPEIPPGTPPAHPPTGPAADILPPGPPETAPEPPAEIPAGITEPLELRCLCYQGFRLQDKSV